jgi:glycosyltransferase involved in cell wall biosynthesis
MNFTDTHIVFLASGHSPSNPRLFYEITTLKRKFNNISIIAPYEKSQDKIKNVNIINIKKYKSRYNRFDNNRALYTQAVKLKPRILHCHEPDSLLVSYLIKKRLKQVKVIYDCHEFHPESFSQDLPFAFRLFAKALIEKIENHLISKIDAVITVNNKLVDRFRNYNNLVTLLPNYPRTELFKSYSRKNDVLNSDHIILIYVGGLHVDRGLFLMLDVIQELYPRLNAKLVLIGGFSSSDQEQMFHYRLNKDSLHKSVIYKGYLPLEVTIRNLYTADIGLFLLCDKKRYHWGEPIKYFEYSAAGLPIVISDMPAKRALINKNQNGIIVAPQKKNAAINAITFLINNPREAQKMSKRGRDAFLREYNWESIENRLLRLYKRLR